MSTIPTSEKKIRDTSNRLDVRLHRATTFLAIAYRGNLHCFFPKGSFQRTFPAGGYGGQTTSVKWIEPTPVKPTLFGLLAYSKTPYKPSKAE